MELNKLLDSFKYYEYLNTNIFSKIFTIDYGKKKKKITDVPFIDISNKNQDYWGKLSIEGVNKDILRQICENKSQKSIMKMETNNLVIMRFKKVIIQSADNSEELIRIESPADGDLTPMKM